jgi:hypothetical protein
VKKAPNKIEILPERRKMSKLFDSQKLQKAIQLIMIVALLASTLAFLPQPAMATGKGSVGTLAAQLNGRKVTVSGTDFIKNRGFIVNAKSSKGSASKLGTVTSNSVGAFKTVFTLPDKFKVVKGLTVCVKDNKTSKRTCVTTK